MVFLETVAIGFIAKTVPQLNILSLGFPMRIMVGSAPSSPESRFSARVLVEFIDEILDLMMTWYSGAGVSVAEDLGEKSEEPTPKKLRDSREEGKVARSCDLTSAIVLAGGSVAVWFGFGPMFNTSGWRCEQVLAEPGLRNSAPGNLG